MSTASWKAQIAVSFVSRNQTSALLTESVSLRSIFVRTDVPPPPMTLLRVHFLLPPDDARLVIHGTVVNTVLPANEHGVPGVEIAFFAKSGEATTRWDRFIQYLQKTHPESIDRPVVLARDAADRIERFAFVDGFEAVDVTPRGLFVVTRQRFAVGSDVCVTLIDTETKEQRAVDCVVRRRASGGDHGIGVEYRNMTHASWTDLVAFLNGGSRSLRAEVQVVRAPHVPMMMQTLPGPWSSDEVPASRPSREDSWSLPPESGWS